MALKYQDLKICAALKRESDDLFEQIARLESALDGKPPALTAQPKGSPREMADMVATLVELQKIWVGKTYKWARHAKSVEIMIDRLQSPDQRRVMRARYVDGLTWEGVADRVHFDRSHCIRLHDNALAKMRVAKVEIV